MPTDTQEQPESTNLPVSLNMASYPVLTYDRDQLEEIINALNDNLGNQTLSDRDLQRITIPSQGLEIWPVQGTEKVEYHEAVEGIIIHTTTPRAYWAKDLDDSGRTPPDCSSPDGIKGSAFGECFACKFNQWGSDPNGDGKACREQRHLFMLRPGQFLPVVVQVPPTSIDAIKKYAVNLATNAKPLWTAITSLRLVKVDKEPFPYSRIVPVAIGDVPQEYKERLSLFRDRIRPLFGSTAAFLLPPGQTQPTDQADQADQKDEASTEAAIKDLYPDDQGPQNYVPDNEQPEQSQDPTPDENELQEPFRD